MNRLAMLWTLTLLFTATIVAACGGSNGGSSDQTATVAATEAPRPSPAATDDAEGGRDPIYWRTLDNFRSVRVNEPYKVVLRVTNGFTEDVLPIEGKSAAGAATIAFEAQRVDAPGEDKGTFYTVNLDFPRQGRYEVTFTAGDAAVSTEINVMAGPGPSG